MQLTNTQHARRAADTQRRAEDRPSRERRCPPGCCQGCASLPVQHAANTAYGPGLRAPAPEKDSLSHDGSRAEEQQSPC